MKKWVILISIILGCQGTYANDSLFEQANTSYTNEDYTTAKERYETLVQQGYKSFELFYNLGNTHFRLMDFVQAVWYYEKARRLRPNDEDVLANIALVNQYFIDDIESLPSLPFSVWWEQFLYGKSPAFWGLLSLSFLLACMLFTCSFWIPGKALMKAIRITCLPLALIGAFAFIAGMAYEDHFENPDQAILFDNHSKVMSEPSNNAIELFTLHQGIKMTLLESQNEWVKIKIANGEVGWIAKNSIRPID